MSFYHGAAPCVVGVYEITVTTPSYRHTQGLRLELNFPPNCPEKNPKFECGTRMQGKRIQMQIVFPDRVGGAGLLPKSKQIVLALPRPDK
jgi:hypothetical protein